MNRIKSFTINHNLLMPGFYCNHAFSGAYVCYLYSQFRDGE